MESTAVQKYCMTAVCSFDRGLVTKKLFFYGFISMEWYHYRYLSDQDAINHVTAAADRMVDNMISTIKIHGPELKPRGEDTILARGLCVTGLCGSSVALDWRVDIYIKKTEKEVLLERGNYRIEIIRSEKECIRTEQRALEIEAEKKGVPVVKMCYFQRPPRPTTDDLDDETFK